MTERSYFWGGLSVGDANIAPYDNDEFSDLWRILFQRNRATQGVIEGHLNELAVTNPSGNDIQMDTGAALVDGKFYEADAAVSDTITTPAVATRVDRVVLRKSWAAQTARFTIITGVEGAGVPAITQNDGVTWDLPIAQVSITTGGTITITDEREYARTPLASEAAPAMFEIETVEGDGTGATLTFANIPSTYKHLMFIGQARFTGALSTAALSIRFNNDTGTNYHIQGVSGSGVTPGAIAAGSVNHIDLSTVPAASGIANYAGQARVMIANYKDTVFFKNVVCEASRMYNTTTTNFNVELNGGMWLNTGAITEIDLYSSTASAGNFATGTKFTLYGLL
jgi:hypothetical protein